MLPKPLLLREEQTLIIPPHLPIIRQGDHSVICPGSEISLVTTRCGVSDHFIAGIKPKGEDLALIPRLHDSAEMALLWGIGTVVDNGLFRLPARFDRDRLEVWVRSGPYRKMVIVTQSRTQPFVVAAAHKVAPSLAAGRYQWRGHCDGYTSWPFLADNAEEALLFCLRHWIDEARWR